MPRRSRGSEFTVDRNFVRLAEVAPVVRASLDRDPAAVERLAGGSKKGV
jgi:hypothetical protein